MSGKKRICHDTIRGRVGDAFSDKEIDDALDRIVRRYEERKTEGEPREETLKKVLGEVGGETLELTLQDKRLKKMALRARQRRKRIFEQLPEEMTEGEKLRAVLVGDERLGAGTGLSVDARRRALFSGWAQEIASGLEELGTLARLANPLRRRDKGFERDTMIELSRLNRGREKATGNAEALQTARILQRVQQKSLKAQNAEGAWIHTLDGYITRQSHDSIKVSGGFWKGMTDARRQQAKKDWIDFIKPRLSPRSFEGVGDVDKYLSSIWVDIVSGHHNVSKGIKDDLDAVRPNGNLAAKASEGRVLHFKKADDWWAYNEKYGQGTFFETYMAQLDRAAANTALMSIWGPNPRAAFDGTRTVLTKSARDRGDVKAIKKIKSHIRDAEFGELDGQTNAPGSIRLATFTRALRLQQALAKLGGMTLSSISDTSLAAHTLQKAGVPLLEGYGSVFGGVTRLQSAERKQAAQLVSVGARQIVTNMVSRFSATDGAYGVMGKMQAQFYTLNLFNHWASGVRSGVGATLSAHLGQNAGHSWAALSRNTRDQLSRYDIDGDAWEILRKQTSQIDGDDTGSRFLTMDGIDRIPAGDLRRWGKGRGYPQPEQARAELRLRLQAYFSDLTETAMTEPRARENALITQGLQAGTPAGEAMRVIMQFKSFPTAVLTRHLLPAARGQGGLQPMAGVAHLIVAGTVLGYVALQAKQLAKGLTPRPLTRSDGTPDMSLLTASLLQGGGLGIFGDFLLADYSRHGSSPLATLSGPTVGEFEGAMRIFGAMKKGDDAKARALRQTIGNVPFANLFYTRAAMDYLVFYQMQEMLNPGSLARYEKRLETERNQTFIFPPSER